ncbi:hypothetical protein RND81_08G174400 [Saponaria officinalis]|uniref:S-protein homolog n=1 Tax=Saponaria officinalis TaxID=3572 RepID=A0AAW1J7V0_SAPOF
MYSNLDKMSGIYKVALALVFVLALTSLVEFSDGGAVDNKVLVTINNTLSDNKMLTVRCKDKHDDLGIRKIKPEDIYQFYADEAFLWSCSFQFGNKFHQFDIYDKNRDAGFCPNGCYYEVEDNKLCQIKFYAYEPRDTHCFDWNGKRID